MTLNNTEATPIYASFFIVEMSLLKIKGNAHKITPIFIKILIKLPMFCNFYLCRYINHFSDLYINLN